MDVSLPAGVWFPSHAGPNDNWQLGPPQNAMPVPHIPCKINGQLGLVERMSPCETAPLTTSEQQSPGSQTAFPPAGPHFAPDPTLFCNLGSPSAWVVSGWPAANEAVTRASTRRAMRGPGHLMVENQETKETVSCPCRTGDRRVTLKSRLLKGAEMPKGWPASPLCLRTQNFSILQGLLTLRVSAL